MIATPLPGLGQREQGVGRAALEQNVGLDVCETASCVEQPPNRVTGLEQQQRISCEAADIDHSGVAKLERWGARGQNLVRRQCEALEAAIGTLFVSDADVNLAAFQHGGLLATKSLA